LTARLAGQLGVGDTSHRSEFTRLNFAKAVLSVAGGAQHSVVATVEGEIWTFGSNLYGQLGLDSEEEGAALRSMYVTPHQIITLRNEFIVDVAAGLHYSFALTAAQEVFAWGLNDVGQLGLANFLDRGSPVRLEGIRNAMSVACGLSHTILILADGSVWGTGNNNAGQLGLGHRNGPCACPVFIS
jgi:alpha-tubulin suppressor-like RCC1 family protein